MGAKENKIKMHLAKTKYYRYNLDQTKKNANSPKQSLDLSVDGMQLTKADSLWDARSFDNSQKLKWLPIDQM